ncbi:glycoside hydrolase family 57 protein [Desulfothermobacter acidiphilus]|uniref:glycoside hydrolase family 57 protein n=1 Tax=Desulfothermobacter acidiphilus TaxID=1938353 RepID=UPI003F88752D
MAHGYLALILHAHLPFVRHPEHHWSLEERWLYEAISECYVPLIWVFQGWERDRIKARLTLSLSPTLLTMMTDPFLQGRYRQHLERTEELLARELTRTAGTPFFPVVVMYRNRAARLRQTLEEYHWDLIGAWQRFKQAGILEIITCAATHGYLPLLMLNPAAVKVQIQAAVELYRQFFGHNPPGFWLPECAYAPGLESYLKAFNIKYFFLDTHGLLFASHRPRFGVFAPIYCPNEVAAFGRDVESSRQVWSAKEGYPGDFDYREYYRDIGFELDYDYIKDFIHPDGIRVATGLKYYRITGNTERKEPYRPEWARNKAQLHAGNFLFNREHQIRYLSRFLDRPPLIVAPYDAELFGHWWFEGPQWLDFLVRKIAQEQEVIELVTPSDYLQRHPCNQVATPCASSWGNRGYHEVWLCGANDWIYRHLHWASDRMSELARDHPASEGWQRRALNQAARELLLAQASDWPFIMATGTVVDYAVRRVKEHLHNFLELYQQITSNRLRPDFIEELEQRHPLFPHLDYRAYATPDP